MKPWALVDFSNLAHRALHTLQGMSHNEVPTGIIFGFFQQLLTVCNDPYIASNRVALFFDSRQSYRRRSYPEYKAKKHQEATPEELNILKVFVQQVKVLRDEILPGIGFPCYRQIGLESDDLIASAADSLRDGMSKERVAVVVTADHDLFQVISDNTHWYDPYRGKYLDVVGYRKETELSSVDQWALFKALAGCHSDNVKGVPGVGTKTAILYLSGVLPITSKKHLAIVSDEGKKTFQRNLGLVRLPHAKTKPVVLREPVYDEKAFLRCCKTYGLASYMEGQRKRDWQDFFAGKMGLGRGPSLRRGDRRD